MASTSIFAPQVRSVQPAFAYFSTTYYYEETKDTTPIEGKVYYYYQPFFNAYWKADVSSGFTDGETYYERFTSAPKVKIYFSFSSYNSDVAGILYTLVDPNIASTWGNNSMIEGDFKYKYINKSGFQDEGDDKFIEIELDTNNFKELTVNQYYQMQLYFVDTNAEVFSANQNWFNNNKNNISEPSQVTLIRPIEQPQITIEQNDKITYDFSKLSGTIADDIETFDSYYYIIGEDKSPTIQGNGKNFSIPIDNNKIVEGKTYSGTFYYTTLHGYQGQQGFSVTYNAPVKSSATIIIRNDTEEAAIDITLPVVGTLQRKSELSGWEDIKLNLPAHFTWSDYTVESGVKYTYRVVYNSNANSTSEANATINFKDIFLSNENTMIAVRYNPNISNFKYVVQESVTNPLGGKYPIVRKNGDTKYKQFTLSGTIYVNCAYYAGEQNDSESSTNINMNELIPNDYSVYSVKSNPLKLRQDMSKDAAETRGRRYVMDFLCDNSPKLFRSAEEGNMIVYLSNISFTPNRQLGRHIYDFSATVTEICEYNSENLNKYKLNLGGYKAIHQSITPSSTIPVTVMTEEG